MQAGKPAGMHVEKILGDVPKDERRQLRTEGPAPRRKSLLSRRARPPHKRSAIIGGVAGGMSTATPFAARRRYHTARGRRPRLLWPADG